MATIGTNIGALNASFYLTQNNDRLINSETRLSSGSRLAIASDDAAGVAVSGKLAASISRLQAATDGAQDVVSFAQTSDGFLQTIQSQLTRMSELAQRATNGAFGSNDRANYNTEYNRIRLQIGSIIQTATFNGTSIFDTSNITVAIDAQGATDTFYKASITTLTDVGIGSVTSISTQTEAQVAITTLNMALQTITTYRAQVNADISKFNFNIANIRTQTTNLQAANSRIADLDVADESTNLSKQQILVQAATSMLSQANTSQQSILKLLQ